MSKKIMKRSLALGALMAFVITGSAMAAELENVENLNSTINGSSVAGGYTLSQDAITISSTTTNVLLANAQISVGKDQTLNLISNAYGGSWEGVIATNVVINSDGSKTGNIIIEQNKHSGNAIGGNGGTNRTIDITADYLKASAYDGSAIYAESGYTVNVDAKNINLIAQQNDRNNNAHGIYARNSIVNLKNFETLDIRMTDTGDGTEGGSAIMSNNNEGSTTEVNIESKSGSVTAYSEGRSAIVAFAGGKLNMDVGSLTVAAKKLTSSTEVRKNSVVASQGAGSVLDLKVSGDVTITGDESAANVLGAQDATLNINNANKITINAENDAVSSHGLSNINLEANDIDIFVDSERGMEYGLYADVESNIDLNAKNNVKIDVSSEFGVGIMADGDYGKNNGGSVIINADTVDIDVHSSSYDATGIWVANRSTETNGKTVAKVVINANSTDIKAIADAETVIDGGEKTTYALANMSQGYLEINGGLTVDAGTVLSTRGGATTLINKDKNATVQLNGDISFNYDGETSDTPVEANVTINLSDKNSYLNGNIMVTGSNIPDKYDEVDSMVLDLSNGAAWITVNDENATENFVNTLNMNGGILNVTKGTKIVIAPRGSGDGWTGSGTVLANTLDSEQVLINKKADNAVITVQAAQNIVDTMTEDNKKDTLEKLADVVYEEGKTATYGVYSAANHVYTPEGTVLGAITANVVDGDIEKESIRESVNTTNAGIAEMQSILLMAWRAENNDMHKRLGELRDANGEHGAWARMTRGESEYKSVKNQYNAYQLGYDQKAGDWTVGAAVTYTEGETSFAKGTGENDHTGLAVYGSKLNKDGSYIDLVAKYANLDHEYTARGGIGSGEYDTDGFALSAEYGKRFEQGNGLWIEPQVELTYGLVDSVDFEAANGRVSLDNMNSLVGRVGFRAGKDIKDGNVYVRASYLYDFEGETDISFTDGVNTRNFEQDLGGGWWELGIGTNINLSKATYIYADVEHACGGEVDTDWKWNLGVRYSF